MNKKSNKYVIAICFCGLIVQCIWIKSSFLDVNGDGIEELLFSGKELIYDWHLVEGYGKVVTTEDVIRQCDYDPESNTFIENEQVKETQLEDIDFEKGKQQSYHICGVVGNPDYQILITELSGEEKEMFVLDWTNGEAKCIPFNLLSNSVSRFQYEVVQCEDGDIPMLGMEMTVGEARKIQIVALEEGKLKGVFEDSYRNYTLEDEKNWLIGEKYDTYGFYFSKYIQENIDCLCLYGTRLKLNKKGQIVGEEQQDEVYVYKNGNWQHENKTDETEN